MDLVNVAEKRVECRTAVNNTVHKAMQKLRETAVKPEYQTGMVIWRPTTTPAIPMNETEHEISCLKKFERH